MSLFVNRYGQSLCSNRSAARIIKSEDIRVLRTLITTEIIYPRQPKTTTNVGLERDNNLTKLFKRYDDVRWGM